MITDCGRPISHDKFTLKCHVITVKGCPQFRLLLLKVLTIDVDANHLFHVTRWNVLKVPSFNIMLINVG